MKTNQEILSAFTSYVKMASERVISNSAIADMLYIALQGGNAKEIGIPDSGPQRELFDALNERFNAPSEDAKPIIPKVGDYVKYIMVGYGTEDNYAVVVPFFDSMCLIRLDSFNPATKSFQKIALDSRVECTKILTPEDKERMARWFDEEYCDAKESYFKSKDKWECLKEVFKLHPLD